MFMPHAPLPQNPEPHMPPPQSLAAGIESPADFPERAANVEYSVVR